MTYPQPSTSFMSAEEVRESLAISGSTIRTIEKLGVIPPRQPLPSGLQGWQRNDLADLLHYLDAETSPTAPQAVLNTRAAILFVNPAGPAASDSFSLASPPRFLRDLLWQGASQLSLPIIRSCGDSSAYKLSTFGKRCSDLFWLSVLNTLKVGDDDCFRYDQKMARARRDLRLNPYLAEHFVAFCDEIEIARPLPTFMEALLLDLKVLGRVSDQRPKLMNNLRPLLGGAEW